MAVAGQVAARAELDDKRTELAKIIGTAPTALGVAIEAGEHAVKGSQAGYRLGIRINSDVLEAQRERFTAERDLARARYDTLLQWLKLKASVGALRMSDLSWINSMLAQKTEPIK